MAGFKNSSDFEPLSEINVTPFVDVMLVLLVIFMVATPLMESGIPIQLPKASAKALPKEETPITLSITKDSRVYLGKEEISFKDLKSKIMSTYKDRGKKEIFIRADGMLPYSIVVQTMAEVKLAGVNKIGLVTVPADKKPSSEK